MACSSVSGDLAVENGCQERQSVSGDSLQSLRPFGPIGRRQLERGDTGAHVVGVDLGDRIEVIR